MIAAGHFAPEETQLHSFLQTDCPVYVHCVRQIATQNGDLRFCQLRLVNCSQEHSAVETLVFDLTGLDAAGESVFTRNGLMMTNCHGLCGRAFGEEHLFSLGKDRAKLLEVRVREVVFENGMIWREQPGKEMLPFDQAQLAGWRRCSCGMPNELSRGALCRFCARPLKEVLPEKDSTPLPEQKEAEPTPTVSEKPAPVRRETAPAPIVQPPLDPLEEADDEEAEGVPGWLSVLVCVLGALAILCSLAFALFFFGGGYM